jgi:hypothetical protein
MTNPLRAGEKGQLLPDEELVLRLITKTTSEGKVSPTEFELSTEDKRFDPPLLSVWARQLTTPEQALGFLTNRDACQFFSVLPVDDIRALRPEPDLSEVKSLDVVWDPRTIIRDGTEILDISPGAEGHAGIMGLMRPPGLPKLHYFSLRFKLAELATRSLNSFADREERPEQQPSNQDTAQTNLQAARANITNELLDINAQQTKALDEAQAAAAAKIAAIDAQIDVVNHDRSNAIRIRLEQTQTDFVRSYLERQVISDASIPGIGATFKSKLQRAGFYTAADIGAHNIQSVAGIGPIRAARIEAWRVSVENAARSQMPISLAPAEENTLQADYEQELLRLNAQREVEQHAYTEQVAAIQADFQHRRAQLNAGQHLPIQ